jgi:murein DD-endopeptidase MepM/ murein hydrolase activator NlpD
MGRVGPHSGVDFRGIDGDPVLAADDGVVAGQMSATNGIGTCVLLEHHCFGCDPFIFYTSYCHLQSSRVTAGQAVVRGQEIAKLGHSGKGAGGVPHVHFSMCWFPCIAAAKDGNMTGTLNPMKYDVGCFDPRRTYRATTKPILTHPIVCD